MSLPLPNPLHLFNHCAACSTRNFSAFHWSGRVAVIALSLDATHCAWGVYANPGMPLAGINYSCLEMSVIPVSRDYLKNQSHDI